MSHIPYVHPDVYNCAHTANQTLAYLRSLYEARGHLMGAQLCAGRFDSINGDDCLYVGMYCYISSNSPSKIILQVGYSCMIDLNPNDGRDYTKLMIINTNVPKLIEVGFTNIVAKIYPTGSEWHSEDRVFHGQIESDGILHRTQHIDGVIPPVARAKNNPK